MIKVNRPAAPVLQCEQGGSTGSVAKKVTKGVITKAVSATLKQKRK
jgi:hypothetical protein